MTTEKLLNLKNYMKFFFTHYDNYLDVLLGLDEPVYREELLEYRSLLKSNRVNFSDEELKTLRIDFSVEEETLVFLKYLELEGIVFN